MRVGISLVGLAPGDPGPPDAYARRLVHALARHGSLEYVVFVPMRGKEVAEGLPTIEVTDAPIRKRGPSRAPLVALSERRARNPAAAEGLDLVHYPLTAAVPSTETPTVVTLHETQYPEGPDPSGQVGRSFKRTAYDQAVRAATAVLVPGEFVRRRTLDDLGLDPTRLHVVPLAVDDTVFHPGDEEPERFVLYPAPASPSWNHTRLLEAFASLRTTRPRLRLLLTGAGHDRFGALPDGVESLGEVSRAALADLYRRAACLAYPALHGGFGPAPLEAFACGCPVASSNAGGLPETCGDAAVLFDPTDVAAIASAIVEADVRRDALRAKGFARARLFTWEVVVHRHEDVYRAASEEP